MKNETALGHVLTLMTIIIWGTTFVSTKVLLEAFTPIEILFFRFTLGYLSLWAIYPRKGTYGTLRQELLFAAAGLCGVTLYFLLENIALTYTFASNVGVCTRKVFFYGLLFMLPALFIFDCRLGLERFASPVNTLNLLYLGFGASALCFVTWNWAVRILGAVKTTVYIYLVPVVTVVSSVIILHETITPLAIAGTALTLTGLIVSQR